MHEAKPRSLVSRCKCLRSGPISSVERSARPCPRLSAWARVILRWRHAPSTRCRSVRRRRGRFAGGACGVELSHRTTLNSLRRRASKLSVVLLHCRVKRVKRRLLCASISIFGCKARVACIARNSTGGSSRPLCPQCWRCHGIGPGPAEDDSGGQVSGPGGCARGGVALWAAAAAARSRRGARTTLTELGGPER
jgi:hypothetical protein